MLAELSVCIHTYRHSCMFFLLYILVIKQKFSLYHSDNEILLSQSVQFRVNIIHVFMQFGELTLSIETVYRINLEWVNYTLSFRLL
jgi:hypothetical protein